MTISELQVQKEMLKEQLKDVLSEELKLRCRLYDNEIEIGRQLNDMEKQADESCTFCLGECHDRG